MKKNAVKEETKTLLVFCLFSLEVLGTNVAKMVEQILDNQETEKDKFLYAHVLQAKLPNFITMHVRGN